MATETRRNPNSEIHLLERIRDLEHRLLEADETLQALRNGHVDALVVSGPQGDCVYTLKGAEQSYRLFVQEMVEGAVTLLPDGLIVFCNEQFAQIIDIPLEHVIGSRIHSYADEENAAIIDSLLAPDTDGSNKHELFLKASNGLAIPVYISANRLIQDDVESICAVITDLRQMKARAKTAESEERFRSLVSVLTDVPWTTDPDGRFIEAQSAWMRYTGQSWEQLRGFGWINAIHPDDRAALLQVWNESRVSKTIYLAHGRFWHAASRSFRHFEARATPLLNSSGEVREWVGTYTDVEQQKLFERALQESAERFRFLSESVPQKMFTATPSGDFDYVNQQWTAFTGRLAEELHGWGWTSIIHPDDLEENLSAWGESIASGIPFKCIHRFRSADGSYRWHLSRAMAMKDSSGQISMWIGSNTDIHEEKETEAELRRANSDLEQFAFSASHDLQEPIRNISIYSELLFERYGSALDTEAKGYLNFVTSGVTRLERLTRDLLDYTQSGKAVDDFAGQFEAGIALEKAKMNLSEAIREAGAQIVHNGLPTLPVPEIHLEQLFQNMLGNAIKYRNTSTTPYITVCSRRQGEFWQFSIQDNGIGIDPAYKEKVFGIFKRLHTERTYSGTGIGLAICKRIVERNGGRIWVESAGLNQGSVFHFTLPA